MDLSIVPACIYHTMHLLFHAAPRQTDWKERVSSWWFWSDMKGAEAAYVKPRGSWWMRQFTARNRIRCKAHKSCFRDCLPLQQSSFPLAPAARS